MKIGIIGALKQEINFIKNKIEHKKKIIYFNHQFYTGKINEKTVILVQSNIGKVSAGIATTLLITLFHPNFIINIGSAGSLNKLLLPGDIVLAKSITYHDVDLNLFGYSIGNIPNCPIEFDTDKNITNFIKNIIYKKKYNFLDGLIISGDSFISKNKIKNKIKQLFPKAIAVEMESAAIAHTCYLFKIPLATIRTISDLADENSFYDFKKFKNISEKKVFHIINVLTQNNLKSIFSNKKY